MITTEQVISIGKITRTHGKRGEVQCLMSNEYWDNADANFLILNINNILVPFRVTDWKGKGSDSLIFQIAGITNEQEAQQLIGGILLKLGVRRRRWPALMSLRVLRYPLLVDPQPPEPDLPLPLLWCLSPLYLNPGRRRRLGKAL